MSTCLPNGHHLGAICTTLGHNLGKLGNNYVNNLRSLGDNLVIYGHHLGPSRALFGDNLFTTWALLGHCIGLTWELLGENIGTAWALLVEREQSSYLSRISQLYLWRKNLPCGEISAFYTEFEQFMEFYRSLGHFCSKSMWRKICAEKIYVEKKWQIWGVSGSVQLPCRQHMFKFV